MQEAEVNHEIVRRPMPEPKLVGVERTALTRRHRLHLLFNGLSIQALAVRQSSESLTFQRRNTMRFMIIVKASQDSEAGVMPSEQLLTDMGNYNEELAKAGILVSADGLHPSSKGARVRFSGETRSVIDGPFAETKELIAGYWIWDVKSKEEAIEWVKRCPNPMPGTEAEIEIRQIFCPEDFGAEFTPQLREQEERIREQAKKH